jgi:uncharacterized phage protein (TIGR02218 family)
MNEALLAHMATGSTTVARAWVVTRRDGFVLGFTDHDRDLLVDGVQCRADSGLTARALQQTTGLSVDNTEAAGALSAGAITEGDLIAGRYDGASVRVWLVNWATPEIAGEIFRGTMGEVVRSGSAFRTELRGLSEALNQPQGLAYTRSCSAVLGDGRCKFDLTQPGFRLQTEVAAIALGGSQFVFSALAGFDDRWFEAGRIEIISGAAAGLSGVVKSDRTTSAGRIVELWQSIRAPIVPGDEIILSAGCDRRATTCRTKFANFLNFRGFPHLPGDDWLSAYPRSGRPAAGGSLSGGAGAFGA